MPTEHLKKWMVRAITDRCNIHNGVNIYKQQSQRLFDLHPGLKTNELDSEVLKPTGTVPAAEFLGALAFPLNAEAGGQARCGGDRSRAGRFVDTVSWSSSNDV